MTKTFKLYGTSACHLCELAHSMVTAQPEFSQGFSITEVDISAEDELFERYGVRIPVLRAPDGRELEWPFAESELRLFLES